MSRRRKRISTSNSGNLKNSSKGQSSKSSRVTVFRQSRLSWFTEFSPPDKYTLFGEDKLSITSTKLPRFRNEEKTILLKRGWEIDFKPNGWLDGFFGWILGYKNIILTPRQQFGDDDPITLNKIHKGSEFYSILQNIL